MAHGGGRPKADEWRNFMTFYPLTAAVGLRMWDRSPSDEAPLPAQGSKVQKAQLRTQAMSRKRRVRQQASESASEDEDETPRVSRNYHDHYENILRACTAIEMFNTRSHSVNEAAQAQAFLSEAAQSWATMGCNLMPTVHLAMHMFEVDIAYGSLYTVAEWAFERCMGILGRIRTNNHHGGALEATYMRAWWKIMHCQDLVRFTSTHVYCYSSLR